MTFSGLQFCTLFPQAYLYCVALRKEIYGLKESLNLSYVYTLHVSTSPDIIKSLE